MTGHVRIYALAPEGHPQALPVAIYGLSADEARGMSAGCVVMWSPSAVEFGLGYRTPDPSVRFFHDGGEVINPWAFFKPLRQPGVRNTPRLEPRTLDQAGEEYERYFDEFDT